MKKVFSFVLVLVLVLSIVVAEGTSSKPADDVTVITTEVEGLSIITDAKDKTALEEFDKLAACTAEGYFGQDVIARVKNLICSDDIEIREFMAVYVQGYEEEIGNVEVDITFPSIQEMINKAAILIGLKSNDATYSWKEYEAICADDGNLDVVFNSETLQRVQDESGLLVLIVPKDKGKPSKTVADMTYITTSAEDFVISVDAKDETALKELDKLKGSTTKAYFGEEMMNKVKKLLGKDEAVIAEFVAIYVENYKKEMGDIVADIIVPYTSKEGEKIAVLISPRNSDDGVYEWKEYLGIGTKDGSVEVEFDGEMLQEIQGHTGLLVLVI